ncbi:hypothetical protein KA183_13725 [bacterium]|nr:hypothetical protein [bacterium]QQR60233.1 MAG: hypothetical protein IPG59_15660 [Candidatus Melainabacteria bacterium]
MDEEKPKFDWKKNAKWALEKVPGATVLFEWFGYWPSFHDAEIISLELNRKGISNLNVYFWNTDWSKVLPNKHFFQDKYVIVHFAIENINDLELYDFSHQNVVSCLTLAPKDNLIEIEISPCYGISGYILAEKVSVSLTPGMPEGT